MTIKPSHQSAPFITASSSSSHKHSSANISSVLDQADIYSSRKSHVFTAESENHPSIATIGSSSYAVFRKLRSLVPECASLSDTELVKVASQTSDEMMLAKQKVLAFTFQSLGIESRQYIKSNLTESERKAKEDVFRAVFNQLVSKELSNLSFEPSLTSSSILSSKINYIKVLTFLVDAIQRISYKASSSVSKPSIKKAFSTSSLREKAGNSTARSNLASTEKQSILQTVNVKNQTSGTNGRLTSIASMSNITEKHPLAISDSVLSIAREANRQNSSSKTSTSGTLKADKTDIGYFEEKNRLLSNQSRELKQEMDQLKKAYTKLQAEYTALKDLRRIMLLKSQNIQLFRQVDLYKNEIVSREESVYDVSGAAKKIQTKLKELFSGQEFLKEKEKKSQFMECLGMLESMYKHSTRHVRDHLDPDQESRSTSFRFVSAFVSSKGLLLENSKNLTIDDISSGGIGHINLRHVSRLENEMHTLYGELTKLDKCISTAVTPNISSIIEKHVLDTLQSALNQTMVVAEGLFSLQLLIPAPPLPKLDKVLKDPGERPPTLKAIVDCLPVSTKTKLQEPLLLLEKSLATEQKLHSIELDALKKELKFHQDVYSKYNIMISEVVQKLDSRRKHIAKLLIESVTPLADLQQKLGSLELTREAVTVFLEDFESTLAMVMKRITELENIGSDDK
ncbi:hypothetical protein BDEG_21005 [Batrachochytrium dendrobatidis JEL423]|uniref:Uncharacterized protein n=1 Tax=Batrachochytrium dendrobatidis (strain JEL423) TaxID=403673 RepID=A0A177W9X5_BATDL|nr:hypothetical protein BDEG_21005 [Batrachochytrium dendrobatidis JEL423]